MQVATNINKMKTYGAHQDTNIEHFLKPEGILKLKIDGRTQGVL